MQSRICKHFKIHFLDLDDQKMSVIDEEEDVTLRPKKTPKNKGFFAKFNRISNLFAYRTGI